MVNMSRIAERSAASGQDAGVRTRFAPSPTGRLHLGHAYSAVRAHALAREHGGVFLIRIDDLDPGRSRADHVTDALSDLDWLGLNRDGAPIGQSARHADHAAGLARLVAMGLAYPCFCTRAEIAAEHAASAAAPHGAFPPPYPGMCRALSPAKARERLKRDAHGWRLDMQAAMARAGPLYWHDSVAGEVRADPGPAGDILLARKDAPASYHFASTLDDAALAISDVVRGADLFASTHIHRLLQALLDLPTPRYHHHALIAGTDGRRLAKRDGGAELALLRRAGADGPMLAAALARDELPAGYSFVTGA